MAIRSCITNYASLNFGNLFWLTDKSFFSNEDKYQETLAVIDKEIQNSKEDFITHFNETYLEAYPPAWMIAEIIPFGSLVFIFIAEKRLVSQQKQIAEIQTGII